MQTGHQPFPLAALDAVGPGRKVLPFLLQSEAELPEAGRSLLIASPLIFQIRSPEWAGLSWQWEGITGSGAVALVPELSQPWLPHSTS